MAWDVDRLVAMVEDAAVEAVALSDIAELDTTYWFDHGYEPTVRAVVEHFRLVQQVDLSYPIVIDPDGRVMDGGHRVARRCSTALPRSTRSACASYLSRTTSTVIRTICRTDWSTVRSWTWRRCSRLRCLRSFSLCSRGRFSRRSCS